MNRCRLLAVLPFLVLAGCPKSDTPDAPAVPLAQATPADTGAFKDLDPWVLKTTDPNANRGNHGIYLSSGMLGATFGASGGAGKDSKAFVAGVYDNRENLQPLADWKPGELALKPGEPYEQSLDLKRGVLTTKLGSVTTTALVYGYNSITNVNSSSAKGSGRDEPDGSWSQVTSYTDPTKEYAKLPDWPTVRKSHEDTWAKRWEGRDIVIDGDPEAQQLVHKLMFDLIQSVQPNGTFSVAPEALSGDFYKGHIFWDAEVWMFPALLAQHPDLARSLLEYRFEHLAQAKAIAAKQGLKGADFPWESAKTGNETVQGTFSQERHVTAGIGWAVWQYWLATDDKAWMSAKGWPLLSSIADYWASRATKTGRGWEILKVIGPDELQNTPLDNNAYTNAMAQRCLLAAAEVGKALGKPLNPQWTTVANGMYFPKNSDGVILKCDDDKGKPGTKQADGELLLWPAQLPAADAKTFDFHKVRPIKNGPAMTDSVHALIAARLGRAAEAEEEFRASYRPFVRGPFLLFSEKRSLDRCVFTTGCGGVLQAVLYGFGGLDFAHWDAMSKAPVALPKGWKKLEIQGVCYKGKRYTVTVTPQGRTVTPAARG
ncbi:hypothetical protein [Armatimonas rosea]|uniref:Trehalose/maltose hydrolase-like predicted phosphorylase n=1 Tax=Armatimonas rosea TaxID=685828 RepID=A0A7W9W8V8_ARMRO|nr:hypothetical protein [Armatimonas rosea]MBB6052545.1 trehalose/maltose hydrolase-like predicted phosphorylase [Armatimonas rosea]